MKRALYWVMALAFVMFLAPAPEAATLNGTVLEAGTDHGINAWGDLYAYRYVVDTDEWVFENQDYVDSGKLTFSIPDLPEGTYYLLIETNGSYVSKFYRNTTKFDQKTLITLTAAQVRDLGTIYMALLPIRLDNCQVTGSPVPTEGGTVTVSCDVVNDTAQAKKILVWPLYHTYRVIYNQTRSYCDSQFAPAKFVTVEAHSSAIADFSMVVSRNAPEGDHDIQMNCGFNRYTPLIPGMWAGYFHTGPASE